MGLAMTSKQTNECGAAPPPGRGMEVGNQVRALQVEVVQGTSGSFDRVGADVQVADRGAELTVTQQRLDRSVVCPCLQ